MFHSSHPSLFGRPSGVMSGTRDLTFTVDTLRDLSMSLLSDSRAGPDASGTLSDFAAQLSTYFDAEESGDYYATLGRADEAFRTRAGALQQTHDDLRVAVASLRHLAHSTVTSDTFDLGRRIGSVLDEFERHEEAEARLLQDFFQHDHAAPSIAPAS
jgi:hypothetical protein